MTQAMIKGSVTGAIIRISREKKRTLTYITKKVQTWVNAKIIKKETKTVATHVTRAKIRKRVTRAIIRVMSKK